MTAEYSDGVFINCPFDAAYRELFLATLYTVYRCGFLPRCSLEEDNALDNRLQKIEKLIEACKYAVHDISRTEYNAEGLPRFNMPFELGLFFGAKRFGDKVQREKVALVFDRDQYRYQSFISDLSGVDIKAHRNNAEEIIGQVRNWLKTSSKRVSIPTRATIRTGFDEFINGFDAMLQNAGETRDTVSFSDLCAFIEEAVVRQL